VIAYALLFGTWPYVPATMTGASMKAAILLGKPEPRFRSRAGLPAVSVDCSAWVEALLRRDPRARPSADAALKHRSFGSWKGTASMRPTLNAAKRVGVFELPGRRSNEPSDLDRVMVETNAKYHKNRVAVPDQALHLDSINACLSEVSTYADSDGASLR